MVFTNQEGDGQFDIFGSIDGPDHYFINKQIADVKYIFTVRHTRTALHRPFQWSVRTVRDLMSMKL